MSVGVALNETAQLLEMCGVMTWDEDTPELSAAPLPFWVQSWI